MRANEFLSEKWTQKYKSSINCSHPKGFSQKAHCAGKKKHTESMMTMEATCPDCGMCQTHGSLTEIAKGAKDSNGVTKCWPGKHAEGTKKGRNGGQVRNCVPNEGVAEGFFGIDDKIKGKIQNIVSDLSDIPGIWDHKAQTFTDAGMDKLKTVLKNNPRYIKYALNLDYKDYEAEGVAEAAKHGLYYNVNKRKKAGTSRPASSPKAPTAQAWKDAAKTAKTESVAEGLDELSRILDLSGLMLTSDEQFDIIENMVESWAEYHGVDSETIWEDFESVDDAELLDESAAWHRSAGKSKKGGLNRKGVASYRAEHPGSHLQMAVTTKPSKLKPGSKAAKRRKSFCARMGGNKGPMKKPNGDPTRKALALRKWHCE
jgi:hypothetical protein